MASFHRLKQSVTLSHDIPTDEEEEEDHGMFCLLSIQVLWTEEQHRTAHLHQPSSSGETWDEIKKRHSFMM